MRYFQKAMRRAEIPIAFTSGYSPHMIMSFAQPLGVGVTSDGEYFDIELTRPISSKDCVEQLNAVMVEGIDIVSMGEISEDRRASGMAIVAAADYLVRLKTGPIPEEWYKNIQEFLCAPQISIMKKTKKSEREVDIKPMIYECFMKEEGLFLRLCTGSEENLKPNLVMQAFLTFMGVPVDALDLHYHRMEVYAKSSEGPEPFCTLESLGTCVSA